MLPLIAPAAMRRAEARCFAQGTISSIDAMECAARALADAVALQLPCGASIYLACGVGGNGGDGFACARLLCDRYRCTIVLCSPPKHEDAIENLRRAQACGIPVYDSAHLSELPPPDAWVDALFGTGLSRAPEGAQKMLICAINAHHQSGSKVFSADIPSGLRGKDGRAYDPCIQADCTVCFQHLKLGLKLGDGLDRCGSVQLADISLPAFDLSDFDARLLEPSDLIRLLPPRPRNIHKGDCGHLLIIAGSFGMAGAAALCACAALRSGVGLLTIACVRSIVPILQTLAPQAMCIALDEIDGAIAPSALPAVRDALLHKNAVVIGPGCTRRLPPEIVRAVLDSNLPAVIDADALNVLSEHRELFKLLCRKHVLTPHPGEAARLSCDFDPSDPLLGARTLASLGANCLLKGASSVIVGERDAYVSSSGGCGMARGGSGDILSGITGALLASGEFDDCALAAAVASEIHGLAGERAQQKYGSRAMNSKDILEFLPEVFPA